MSAADTIEGVLTLAGALMEDASPVALFRDERTVRDRAIIIIGAGLATALLGAGALCLDHLVRAKLDGAP
jgi:hypothetical protein